MNFDWNSLTPVQKVIVAMLARGLSLKQIAVQRGRSLKTIKDEIYNARHRVGIVNTVHMVALAVKSGHVDPSATE